MNFSNMVWMQGRDGWYSRPVTAGDMRRRALMRDWAEGKITFKEVAAIVREEGISTVECEEMLA